MSFSEALSIGSSGLAASQLAINIAGQNISNANTAGYSRKVVNQASAYRKDGSFGEMGFGVNITSIGRITDQFVNQQLNGQTTQQGYASDLNNAYSQIEGVNPEPSDTGINECMNKFWSAWSDLANNPSDTSAREALKSTTQVLTDNMHYTSTQLTNYQSSINDQVQSYVGTINSIADKISVLNKTIVASEGQQTNNANDARDQRDQLITQLSSYMNISTVEDSSGAITVTASGNMLVSPEKAEHLETSGQKINDPSGGSTTFYGVQFVGSDSTFSPQGGKLQAMFDIRDKVIPQYLNSLNAIASTLVQKVNAASETGYTLNKTTGVDFFDPAKTTAANISLSAAVVVSSNNIAAAAGGTLQSMALTAATVPPAPVSDANNMIDLSSANPQFRNVAQGSLVITDPATGKVLQEGAGQDYIVDYSLGQITMLNTTSYPAGSALNLNFQYNTTGYSGDGDGSNALAISQISNANTMDPDLAGNPTQTIAQNYAGMIGTLGVQSNESKSNLDAQNALVQQLTNQQASVSGVNLDEEMTNLIKFQQSYSASAKFITTLSSMMDALNAISTT